MPGRLEWAVLSTVIFSGGMDGPEIKNFFLTGITESLISGPAARNN